MTSELEDIIRRAMHIGALTEQQSRCNGDECRDHYQRQIDAEWAVVNTHLDTLVAVLEAASAVVLKGAA